MISRREFLVLAFYPHLIWTQSLLRRMVNIIDTTLDGECQGIPAAPICQLTPARSHCHQNVSHHNIQHQASTA
ncbi:hypothetical protein EJ08DRAFT_644516 [Tothia fuscella]|uniref:Uncharacterized protein n=1 Tax=Tothia fuscella TaxID=1048955 RepID=A0A9P4P2B3_9PEZI|nr:hypothetical protein EJ08DRAFT_644516 [Tothia fuscella]